MHRMLCSHVLVCGAGLASAASAQQPPAPSTGSGQAPQAAAPAPAASQPAGQAAAAPAAYSYDSQGRRDPFVSLLTRGNDPRSMANRPPGPGGLLISEVTVKGIVRDRSGFIAMIQGGDTKTYMVRVGEKLMDGSVKSISSDVVVFSQDVNDPLSTIKQKEVRKSVRPIEDGRG
jgi:Tfp pilus assembly protein PilP